MGYKEGALVRVHNPTMSEDADMLAEHGSLWLYIGLFDDVPNLRPLHACKSLATGHVYHWYDEEFEVHDDEA